MRSGSLTQLVAVYRMVDKQSPSGALTKEKMLIANLRCALLRQQSSFGIEANAEDDKIRLVFETWMNPKILDTDTLLWCNQEFRITLLEYNYQNRTMKIHAIKITK